MVTLGTVLYLFIEGILLMMVGTGIVGIRLSVSRLMVGGLGIVLGIQALRYVWLNLLGLKLGAHVIISILIIGLVLYLVARFKWQWALIGSVVGQILITVGEPLLLFPTVEWVGLPYEVVVNQPLIYVAIGLSGSGFLILTAVLTYGFKLSLVKDKYHLTR